MRVITDSVLSQTGRDIEDTVEELEWLMAKAGETARQTGKDIKEVIRELGRQDIEALIDEIERNEAQAREVIENKIKGRSHFDTNTMVEIELTKKQAEIVDTIFILMDKSLKSLCNNQKHNV